MGKLFLLPLFMTALLCPAYKHVVLLNEFFSEAKELKVDPEKKTVMDYIPYPDIETGYLVKNYDEDAMSQGIIEIHAYPSIKQNLFTLTDTVILPTKETGLPEAKVVFSNGTERIEFTPYSTLYNGALIQPINPTNNKGVSTSFYLRDSASWSFYTNATQRMLIQGDGNIVTKSTLLINNAVPDHQSALRVKGIARFDSGINIRATSDTNSFISLNRNIKSSAETDDGISPYTFTPTGWANGRNIPGLRLRHPNNVSNKPNLNTSIARDFLIVPYEFGTAIEYNGVVECWVGEWSIHRGGNYNDVEGKGNGWGGVLWVGNDFDDGGVRATARNNFHLGGNVQYGEISVEKFLGTSAGDFRLRLPSTNDAFQFVYGERGGENIVAKISNDGFFIPKVSSVTTLQNPEPAQLIFDNTDSEFKGYNGIEWIKLTDNGLKTGNATQSANGTKDFVIAHGLPSAPSYFNVLATSPDAANIGYVTTDQVNLIIHYLTAPKAGSNNLSWNWQVKK